LLIERNADTNESKLLKNAINFGFSHATYADEVMNQFYRTQCKFPLGPTA